MASFTQDADVFSSDGMRDVLQVLGMMKHLPTFQGNGITLPVALQGLRTGALTATDFDHLGLSKDERVQLMGYLVLVYDVTLPCTNDDIGHGTGTFSSSRREQKEKRKATVAREREKEEGKDQDKDQDQAQSKGKAVDLATLAEEQRLEQEMRRAIEESLRSVRADAAQKRANQQAQLLQQQQQQQQEQQYKMGVLFPPPKPELEHKLSTQSKTVMKSAMQSENNAHASRENIVQALLDIKEMFLLGKITGQQKNALKNLLIEVGYDTVKVALAQLGLGNTANPNGKGTGTGTGKGEGGGGGGGKAVAPVPGRKANCMICYSDLPVSAMLSCDVCDTHLCMGECCLTWIENRIHSNQPMKCPSNKCEGHGEFREEMLLSLLMESNQAMVAEGSPALTEMEVLKLVSDYRNQQAQRLFESMPGNMRCPFPGCDCVMVATSSADSFGGGQNPDKITCPQCRRAFCVRCKNLYHYFLPCGDIADVTANYLSWCSQDRENFLVFMAQQDEGYRNALAEFEKNKEEHYANTREARLAFEALINDEKWKESNCRHCPHCNRLVWKTDGCNSMTCGKDAEDKGGGNKQPGCMKAFRWNEAKKYKAASGNAQAKLADMEFTTRAPDQVSHYKHQLVEGVPLPCDICTNPIEGPLFRCLHCPDHFNCCVKCEATAFNARTYHTKDHIFQLIEGKSASENRNASAQQTTSAHVDDDDDEDLDWIFSEVFAQEEELQTASARSSASVSFAASGSGSGHCTKCSCTEFRPHHIFSSLCAICKHSTDRHRR